MLVHEIFSLFESLDILLSEGFKDDMFNQYPDDKENPKFKNAISTYNSNPKIKEALKRIVKPQGNIALSIKKQYPTGTDFINLISDIVKKEEDRELYNSAKAGNYQGDVKDFWLIPCRTFEDVHNTIYKYTGKLPRLTNNEIKAKYNEKTPEAAEFYETDKSPEEFLEIMKKEDRFYMRPSWCIAYGKHHFDHYHLETTEGEKPKCYVLISKAYPNVRFCISLWSGDVKENVIEGNKLFLQKANVIKLAEVRDPWQTGGFDRVERGLKMLELAFGKDKIDNFIKSITYRKEIGDKEVRNFNRMQVAKKTFYEEENLTELNQNFSRLKRSELMCFSCNNLVSINSNFPVLEEDRNSFMKCSKLHSFKGNLNSLKKMQGTFDMCTNLEVFDAKLPSLIYGYSSFRGCRKLKSFTIDMPILEDTIYMFAFCYDLKTFKSNTESLEIGTDMFVGCSSLENIDMNLSKLSNGYSMFNGCESLSSFDIEMPLLKNASLMFGGCDKLQSFNSNIPELENGKYMFFGCKNLTSFNSDLSNLKDGDDMFKDCKLDLKSLKRIAMTLPSVNEESKITLGLESTKGEFAKYIQIIKDKGWTVEV